MTTIKPEETTTATDTQLEAAVLSPKDFEFGAVPVHPGVRAQLKSAPALGPLASFTGTFAGNGFNTIFRPQSSATPTPLPVPVGGDNVLELNLTHETLSFSKSLGEVPNRGMVQGDVFLNGVPYLQTISDITGVPAGQPGVGIHFEPGLWMHVPKTADPAEGSTLVRMASIPHGTTVVAQGTSSTIAGAPTIPPVSITPTFNGGGPIEFPSQTATNNQTARIPQDLSSFIAAGTITQKMLKDPNSLLGKHIAGQKIVSTTKISVSTNPSGPLFGGGVDNIAFLLGDAAALTNPNPPGPNAQALSMQATFWIETVEHKIVVPPGPAHQALTLLPEGHTPDQPTPKFVVHPPTAITAPHPIVVHSTQIQYSQQVMLNFNGLTWPHVSVATLVPAKPIAVAWS